MQVPANVGKCYMYTFSWKSHIKKHYGKSVECAHAEYENPQQNKTLILYSSVGARTKSVGGPQVSTRGHK